MPTGFPAAGFDASEGLLAEARRRYPGFKFAHAELPDLKGIARPRLRQCAVRNRDHASRARADRAAVRRLLDIVKPSGILYLSWRVTEKADLRDAQGVSMRRSMPRWCWRN